MNDESNPLLNELREDALRTRPLFSAKLHERMVRTLHREQAPASPKVPGGLIRHIKLRLAIAAVMALAVTAVFVVSHPQGREHIVHTVAVIKDSRTPLAMRPSTVIPPQTAVSRPTTAGPVTPPPAIVRLPKPTQAIPPAVRKSAPSVPAAVQVAKAQLEAPKVTPVQPPASHSAVVHTATARPIAQRPSPQRAVAPHPTMPQAVIAPSAVAYSPSLESPGLVQTVVSNLQQMPPAKWLPLPFQSLPSDDNDSRSNPVATAIDGASRRVGNVMSNLLPSVGRNNHEEPAQ